MVVGHGAYFGDRAAEEQGRRVGADCGGPPLSRQPPCEDDFRAGLRSSIRFVFPFNAIAIAPTHPPTHPFTHLPIPRTLALSPRSPSQPSHSLTHSTLPRTHAPTAASEVQSELTAWLASQAGSGAKANLGMVARSALGVGVSTYEESLRLKALVAAQAEEIQRQAAALAVLRSQVESLGGIPRA